MTAFVLLGVCGQHHALAAAELGGTEVLMSDAMRPEPKSLPGLPRIVAPAEKGGDASQLGDWSGGVREIISTQ